MEKIVHVSRHLAEHKPYTVIDADTAGIIVQTAFEIPNTSAKTMLSEIMNAFSDELFKTVSQLNFKYNGVIGGEKYCNCRLKSKIYYLFNKNCSCKC